MNTMLLNGLSEENRDKYILLKEAQELLYQVAFAEIRGKAHTEESQTLYTRLMELDASIELVEVSIENAEQCLGETPIEDFQALVERDRELYNKTLKNLN